MEINFREETLFKYITTIILLSTRKNNWLVTVQIQEMTIQQQHWEIKHFSKTTIQLICIFCVETAASGKLFPSFVAQLLKLH